VGPKLFFQGAGFVGDEFIFYFVKLKLLVHLTQLSYSVNDSLSEVAVHGGAAGISGQKHAAKRLSVPQEKPYESWKKQLFCYFFSASAKKVRRFLRLKQPEILTQLLRVGTQLNLSMRGVLGR
jgi:hypothetical protein